MNWLTETAILVALLAATVGVVVVVVVSGADALPPTGLKDLAILLGGALAGTKIPK